MAKSTGRLLADALSKTALADSNELVLGDSSDTNLVIPGLNFNTNSANNDQAIFWNDNSGSLEFRDVTDIYRDSAFVTNIVDTGYVQSRQVDIYRDSNFITNIIDSDYVTARAPAGGGGGGGVTWAEINSTPVTLAAGSGSIVDTSSLSITLNLPSSPSLGDEVSIIDGKGNASNNNITIGANGNKLVAEDSDITIEVDRAAFSLVYYDTTNGWIFKEV